MTGGDRSPLRRPFGGRARGRRLAVLTAVAFLGVLGTASAQAATYTVGTTSDTSPGTACSPSTGTCSLREIIEFENGLATTPSSPDTVVVPAGTYDISQGAVVIKQSLQIFGAGARSTRVEHAAGAAPDRVFDIQVPAGAGPPTPPTVFISGLTVSGGTAGQNNNFFGGDIRSTGKLTLSEDWITNGTASSGGGVTNDAGNLAILHSLISGNHASTGGGDSGGVQNHGNSTTPAQLFVDNSTVSNNDARVGAGIFSWADSANVSNAVAIRFSTIADNSTQDELSGTQRGPGAGLLVSSGAASVQNSIVANNTQTVSGTATTSNCSTGSGNVIGSLGNNLESQIDCGFTATGDLQITNPLLTSTSAQNNGGNTDTLAPATNSPAVNHISALDRTCNGTDQRDVARPQGGRCDIGAVELAVAPPPPPPPPPATAPPSVATGTPGVTGTTSATFSTIINPGGLPTTVHFEYARVGDPRSVTPEQAVGSDRANHTVTLNVGGLLPNSAYVVRAVATNSAGVTPGADQSFTTPSDPSPPPPVLAKSVNVQPVSGQVLIKVGGQFIPLTEAHQIPVGSILDATAGTVQLTAAATAKGKAQFGDFSGGIFAIIQQRGQRGLTGLHLIDGQSRQACTRAGGAKAGKAQMARRRLSNKVLGLLNGSAHGRFTTQGSFSAATVRGTIWSVSDRCDGTLTTVARGTVAVRDFRLHKTIMVHAGESYLAKAPGA